MSLWSPRTRPWGIAGFRRIPAPNDSGAMPARPRAQRITLSGQRTRARPLRGHAAGRWRPRWKWAVRVRAARSKTNRRATPPGTDAGPALQGNPSLGGPLLARSCASRRTGAAKSAGAAWARERRVRGYGGQTTPAIDMTTSAHPLCGQFAGATGQNSQRGTMHVTKSDMAQVHVEHPCFSKWHHHA